MKTLYRKFVRWLARREVEQMAGEIRKLRREKEAWVRMWAEEKRKHHDA